MQTSTPVGDAPETKAERLAREAGERFRLARVAAMREPPEAPEPTEHLPGSVGKIEVLRWRVANGYRLWHSRDVKRNTQ